MSAQKPIKFRTRLELMGVTATGIVVPPEIVEQLGKGKKPPVKVTINKHTYRSTIAFMGGQFLLVVNAAAREASGVKANDEIVVTLELDNEPRTVEVPADLQQALDAEPKLKVVFDKMSYTHRKEYVRAIEDAKKAETRQSRILKTIEALRNK
jgi:hypothetical protein